MKPHDMQKCAAGNLCDECLARWLNRKPPLRRWSGRPPATIRSHAEPWFSDAHALARSAYVASVFWFALEYPNLPIINVDPQMEAGHA